MRTTAFFKDVMGFVTTLPGLPYVGYALCNAKLNSH